MPRRRAAAVLHAGAGASAGQEVEYSESEWMNRDLMRIHSRH